MTKPRIRENHLNLAEYRVLEAFRGGVEKIAVMLPPVENSNFPQVGHPGELSEEDWESAILRSEFLRDLYLGNYGELDTRRVEIRWAKVSGRLDLSYCRIRQPILFRQCFFSEGISLLDSVIPILHLKRCLVRGIERGYDLDTSNALNANRLKSGHVMLDKGFIADGDVSLGGAVIDGHLDCSGGIFEGGFLAQGLKAGDVRLNNGFTAKGEVNLINADIDGQVICQGGIFNEKFTAQSLNAEVVFMNHGFIAKNEVFLFGAKIKGQFSCRGGKFNGGINAQGTEVVDVILGDGFIANRDVKFMNARIDGQLTCIGGKFMEVLELADAKIGTFVSDKQSWPRKGSLRLDGFCYQWLVGDAADSAEAGLDWLSRTGEGEFYPHSYEQLMSVYRRMGRPDWARKVGFKLEKRRHRGYKKRGDAEDNERRWWDIWYEILRVTIGYGYKPFRSLGWILGLWLGGTLVFGGANLCGGGSLPPQSLEEAKALFLGSEDRSECSNRLILPLEGHSLISRDGEVTEKRTPEHYPQFVPVVYALEALFPVLNFGQLEKWHPGSWLSGIRWGMTFLGTSLLAILALFGVGVLGPQLWRSGKDSV
ncbi:MAG: hypothetical protein OXU53_10635 [Deltaproteobacteria bacterium]|nr:hypothetical protein [Deltaproteobacteria bacterium]